jgi:hypothetical protein
MARENLTPGQKAALTRKRRQAGKKAALTKKRRAAGQKAAVTKVRRKAAKKAWETRRAQAVEQAPAVSVPPTYEQAQSNGSAEGTPPDSPPAPH